MLTSVVMTRRSQMHNISVILRSCCGPSTAVLKRSQQNNQIWPKKKTNNKHLHVWDICFVRGFDVTKISHVA